MVVAERKAYANTHATIFMADTFLSYQRNQDTVRLYIEISKLIIALVAEICADA